MGGHGAAAAYSRSAPCGSRIPLERAIRVVYRLETERISHDFHARLTDQFDLVIHLDETHALEPLDRTAEWETGEVLELYPWGV